MKTLAWASCLRLDLDHWTNVFCSCASNAVHLHGMLLTSNRSQECPFKLTPFSMRFRRQIGLPGSGPWR